MASSSSLCSQLVMLVLPDEFLVFEKEKTELRENLCTFQRVARCYAKGLLQGKRAIDEKEHFHKIDEKIPRKIICNAENFQQVVYTQMKVLPEKSKVKSKAEAEGRKRFTDHGLFLSEGKEVEKFSKLKRSRTSK